MHVKISSKNKGWIRLEKSLLERMREELLEATKENTALRARMAELEEECEYDQRNAAMSQAESQKLLERVAELEAALAKVETND